MPPKSHHDAVAIALVFYFQHHAFARLISAGRIFGDDTVQSRAFEAVKPVLGYRGILCCRRDVKRRGCRPQQRLEPLASAREWFVSQVAVSLTKQIKENKRRRGCFGE